MELLSGLMASLENEWPASLRAAWQQARDEHPGVEVSEREFSARAEKFPAEARQHMSPGELYLLCGCQLGQTAALRRFRDEMLGRARLALSRMQLTQGLAEEAEQSVWSKFMVAEPGKDLPLWDYVGRGRLSVFLQVSATRIAVSLLRRENKYVMCEDEALARSVGVSDGLDLALIRQTYEGSFKTALKAAFSALSERQRTMLRLHYVDRVTGDELAKMYRVHRATVTRWLAEARQRLASETRDRVMREAGVTESDFHSLMGVLLSRLDLSMVGRTSIPS
jgi:RNA polymerase sigma-70 factor (ECF subfamily)